ncbi:MAG: hypothetical protein IJ852_04170 [Alphaproteobacteria bacterium]|nr:hypothetical protein [Alphaproteobacteria bacterium]
MRTKTNQNGRSMIEMLGVLAIIGVLSVGGIAGYSKAMQKYRTNKTIEQITLIANGVRTLYSGQRNYQGVNMRVIQKAKILPESAFDGSSSAANAYGTTPFGGNIGIFSGGDYKTFDIELYQVPEDICIELLSQDWGEGMVNYGVRGSIISSTTMTIDNAITACEAHTRSTLPEALQFSFK